MLPASVVATASFAYLTLLFGIAYFADRRAAAGRSVISNAWIYALSMAVYCTAWTYFGSVGRAASAGVWFLPIYLGPTLAMALAWVVLLKMIRIAKTQRITSIADFIASRHGKSHLLGGLVSLITVVGIIPYIALQLKAVALGFGVLTGGVESAAPEVRYWFQDTTLYVALILALFTILFGARHLDATERHEGMVAAIAFESTIKLCAFLAVGVFVVWGIYGGFGDLFTTAMAQPELAELVSLDATGTGYGGWFALVVLAFLSFLLLPRQFQVAVVENVDEQHLRRATWLFPSYLFLINLFVLPIALAGVMHFGRGVVDPDTFVLSLPLAYGREWLALAAFIGGLSAATGMVIVEAIAVSTMICNDLVMPLLLRWRRFHAAGADLTRVLLLIRRGAILLVVLLGYLYFRLAGEAVALVSIGLISFAAVAQFAPAMLGGMFWRGGTRDGALAGLLAGFTVWLYTLLLPSFARSGWLDDGFIAHGFAGVGWLKPEALFGLEGMDSIAHALFWSLLFNAGAYLVVSLLRPPSGMEARQAALFVDVFRRDNGLSAGLWRGRARIDDLEPLMARFLGPDKTRALVERYAHERGVSDVRELAADAQLVRFAETQLAGAIGSASAHVVVSSVVQEEPPGFDEVMHILDEASQIRAYSHQLEEKSQALEQATAELRAANAQLREYDRLKDDFMSSVTHELRTPLTSIRALSEMLHDDPDVDAATRTRFLGIIVSETERLTRLVNQVLDLAKIESGHAEWHSSRLDMREVIEHAINATSQMFEARGVKLALALPSQPLVLHADRDRLLQVMLNLLSNAARWAPDGRGHVTVRLGRENAEAIVDVSDDGPGIEPDFLPHVFDKFRQGVDAQARGHGTGLGLPISRRIVEHFGGRMWVESAPGEGTRFSFSLPCDTSAEPDGDDDNDNAGSQHGPTGGE